MFFIIIARLVKIVLERKNRKGYKVKIKVRAAGDSTYLPKSKTVTVKIIVK